METINTKYIMFGDSIIEYGNWNELLEDINVSNRGVSGDTTRDLLMRFNRSIDKDVDTVFIMVGINDLIQRVKVEKVFENYIEILERLLALEIKPIVQLTLFVGEEFHNLDSSINYNVEQLNTKLLNYCKQNNIECLDVNKILAFNNILKGEYTEDSVHINKKAYAKWAEYIKLKVFNK